MRDAQDKKRVDENFLHHKERRSESVGLRECAYTADTFSQKHCHIYRKHDNILILLEIFRID